MDPDTGEVVVKANHMCTPKRAAAVVKVLEKLGRDSVKIRTILSCKSHIGVCAKCYGANMATGSPVQVLSLIHIWQCRFCSPRLRLWAPVWKRRPPLTRASA